MTIRVQDGKFRLRLPVPLGLARSVVGLMPESVFRDENGIQMDKAVVCELLDAVAELSREYRGLEVIHVEEHGETRVVITL